MNAIKTGMLYNAAVCQTVVDTLKKHYSTKGEYPPIVVDPVCVSTSGHTLLESDALSVVRTHLFPMATLITPNKAEAELLLNDHDSISSVSDMLHAAKRLAALGPKAVLLKGGHIITTLEELSRLPKPTQDSSSTLSTLKEQVSGEWTPGYIGSPVEMLILGEAHDQQIQDNASNTKTNYVADVLYECADPDAYTLFVRPRIETTSTHGTGCTLAAALACEVAQGRPSN